MTEQDDTNLTSRRRRGNCRGKIEGLHGFTRQYDESEDTKHCSEWKKNALNARHDKTEPIILPARQAMARPQNCPSKGDAKGEERQTKNEHDPANDFRRRVTRRRVSVRGRVNKNRANGDMDQRKAGKQERETANDIMKDRKQTQMFDVVSGGALICHALSRLRQLQVRVP
jgi:hypothetical protein